MQSLQDKQRYHHKSAGACEEEIQMLSKEKEERKALHETRFRALTEKSGDSRKAAAELEVEIQAGEERRSSSASQSNGCCIDPAVWEQVFAFGETRAEIFINVLQQEFYGLCSASGCPEQGAGAEEKQTREGCGMTRKRRMSGMRKMRWILTWILIGVEMRMVESAEEEISASARQEMVLRSETPLAPRLQEVEEEERQ